MTDSPPSPLIFRVADLAQNRDTPFACRPTGQILENIARDLELHALRKLSFEGQIRSCGKHDWVLTAKLGATAVQSCVVTLTPITTRIDVDIERRYIADMVQNSEETDEEGVEIPEDENAEPLPRKIHINDIMIEALALHLPLYPRAENAELEQTLFAEKGISPMTDEDARPFSALAALKDKLSDQQEDK